MIKIVLVVNHILNLAEEFIKIIQYRKCSMKSGKKKGLGRGLSALFGDASSKRKNMKKSNIK